VHNQNDSGWSSVIAARITHIGDLKAGPLADHPVVINMSLGGPSLDSMEQQAIDYAIEQVVIIMASAGNEGAADMGYPGAYAPVISVAASGWLGEWTASGWWTGNVPDPTNIDQFYITDFSSRALPARILTWPPPARGSWAPQVNSGQTSYHYLGGTSMASPHVAGILALMAQKSPGLNTANAELYLTGSAIALGEGCRDVLPGPGAEAQPACWGPDATGSGLATADAALNATP
jgi:subtilisin family serine protease